MPSWAGSRGGAWGSAAVPWRRGGGAQASIGRGEGGRAGAGSRGEALGERRRATPIAPELLKEPEVVPVPEIKTETGPDHSSLAQAAGLGELGVPLAHFIMAAGPPVSISARTGLRVGFSIMRAIRGSSCSLCAGSVRPPSMVANWPWAHGGVLHERARAPWRSPPFLC
ncbi:hypothetical protein PVAP13_9KG535700 [Panicum virgatum]|uniref:Uncharacterized protein n=1 Tax=Panicum virgatum TaxID=38727 RepID=A0A8T0NVV9_PANVG|nr:hypothetical protein PVAP13_9KG535700 [Panicum virgatum]